MEMPMSSSEYAAANADMARRENEQLSERVSKLEKRVAELEKIISHLVEHE